MKVLLVDAFDSFVFVIEQYYLMVGAKTKVIRVNNDPISYYEQWKPDLLVLGPGPGTPQEHGYLDILLRVKKQQAIFGVCLGHQAIGEFFGGELFHAPTVEHGKYARVQHDGQGVFRNIPTPINVVRYHSLAITNFAMVRDLLPTAYSEEDNVNMAVRHRTRPIESVQFHPESIGTDHGLRIVENSLSLVNHVVT
ncbi:MULTISPECIES: anthranilate synthase component II [unclassified Brenneria]|uniref:anthranilate synthase component II n=1 Tax=unclassified Brenneria TaxID=2634434 RepID=UPI0018F0D181|nr:aminodeoxychorismate/anthranilate synthase component II [Brenneria sp. L3-3C-1]MBJ7223907.1 aminodeoxychorismate/anthranilate synthase component II [Brenneria sp. L3-3C-1]MEE3645152.1 aminodeoxychorismate/anthranilate synthase component II [Brenneria sp. L3_3C_1]